MRTDEKATSVVAGSAGQPQEGLLLIEDYTEGMSSAESSISASCRW